MPCRGRQDSARPTVSDTGPDRRSASGRPSCRPFSHRAEASRVSAQRDRCERCRRLEPQQSEPPFPPAPASSARKCGSQPAARASESIWHRNDDARRSCQKKCFPRGQQRRRALARDALAIEHQRGPVAHAAAFCRRISDHRAVHYGLQSRRNGRISCCLRRFCSVVATNINKCPIELLSDNNFPIHDFPSPSPHPSSSFTVFLRSVDSMEGIRRIARPIHVHVVSIVRRKEHVRQFKDIRLAV